MPNVAYAATAWPNVAYAAKALPSVTYAATELPNAPCSRSCQENTRDKEVNLTQGPDEDARPATLVGAAETLIGAARTCCSGKLEVLTPSPAWTAK